MDAEPLVGAEETVKTEPSVRPSTSEAERVPVMADVSSAPSPMSSPVMDAESSTAVMVRLMACVVVPPRSSVMVTVKASVPLKLALGA